MIRLGDDGPSEKRSSLDALHHPRGLARPDWWQQRRSGSRDTYGLTAITAAHCADLLSQPGYERSGVLAPAQAFDHNDSWSTSVAARRSCRPPATSAADVGLRLPATDAGRRHRRQPTEHDQHRAPHGGQATGGEPREARVRLLVDQVAEVAHALGQNQTDALPWTASVRSGASTRTIGPQGPSPLVQSHHRVLSTTRPFVVVATPNYQRECRGGHLRASPSDERQCRASAPRLRRARGTSPRCVTASLPSWTPAFPRHARRRRLHNHPVRNARQPKPRPALPLSLDPSR